MLKSLIYGLLISTLSPTVSHAVEEANSNNRPLNSHPSHQNIKDLESYSRPYLLGLPRCDLLTTLSQLGVFIKKDDPQIFTNEMLVHLISFFSLAKPLMPVFLYASTESGPTLVKKIENVAIEGAHQISFSKNAAENLELKSFSEQEAVANKLGQAIVGELKFNNTLFKQLSEILLSKEELKKIISEGARISLIPNPSSKWAKYAIDLKQVELIALLKVFNDIPSHLRKKMALKSIVRMKDGFEFPEEPKAIAIYNKETQEISLTDRAFTNIRSLLGEGTLIHELGHAYWATMDEANKNEFIKISWKKDSSNQYQLNDGNIQMISDYSTKSPEEDFAEHFSGYVDAPEKLKKINSEKFRFFHELFIDTEYQTVAHEKAKIHLESEKPDSTPPTWKWVPSYNKTKWWSFGLINETVPANLSISCEEEKTILGKPEKAVINVKISGVQDNVSGVNELYIILRSSNSYETCGVFLDSNKCVDSKNGIYETSKVIELSEYSPGPYHLDYMTFEDRAGNSQNYNAKDLGIKIEIPGTKEINKGKFSNPNLNFGDIEIKKLNLNEGSAYELSIPALESNSPFDLQFYWKGKKTGYTFTHLFSGPMNSEFFSKKDGKMNFRLIFPNYIPKDDFELSRIWIGFNETKDKKHSSFSFESEDQTRKLSLPHEKGSLSDGKLNIDLNSMKLMEVQKVNRHGGTSSIIVEVPIDGLITSKPEASFFMQAPSGKDIDFFSAYTESKIITKDGKKILQSKLQLLPNHESGEYILKGIWISEDPNQDQHFKAKTPFSSDFKHLRIQASERGIIKKVIIEPSKLTKPGLY
ncbi:MAG: hypothetical protein KA116_04470 [Proteobacteria bacterium]|nr:hypothetical protein [Pseudomonadota bacterium]